MSYVAGNVRRLRITAGWTQEQLAESSGLDPAYVGRVEQAKVNMTVGLLGQLADGLGVDPGDLLAKGKMHRIKKGRPVKT
jgi:transcriptional regulator with XRE-family HTH domain